MGRRRELVDYITEPDPALRRIGQCRVDNVESGVVEAGQPCLGEVFS